MKNECFRYHLPLISFFDDEVDVSSASWIGAFEVDRSFIYPLWQIIESQRVDISSLIKLYLLLINIKIHCINKVERLVPVNGSHASLQKSEMQVFCSTNFVLVVDCEHLKQQSMIIYSLINKIIDHFLDILCSGDISLILTVLIERGKDLPSSQDLIDLEHSFDLVSVRIDYSPVFGSFVFV